MTNQRSVRDVTSESNLARKSADMSTGWYAGYESTPESTFPCTCFGTATPPR